MKVQSCSYTAKKTIIQYTLLLTAFLCVGLGTH